MAEFATLDGRQRPLFVELLEVFADAFEDRDRYLGAVPGDGYLERFLDDPHNVAVVALVEGHVVGGLVAYVLEKFEQERCEVYVYDLAVVEAHRRRHVATGLLEHLRGVASERGAYVMYVQADQGDEPAIALYESLGVREEVLHFDIAVT